MQTWPELSYWSTGEWQVVKERLNDLKKEKKLFNPSRELLFRALERVPLKDVRVVIVGQDPYPDPIHATGIAFSIPDGIKTFPVTLSNIFKEYQSDLHYDLPTGGNLSKWADQGVLLWNAIPSCLQQQSLSHNWEEWHLLTQEILEKVSKEKVVVVLMGGVARDFAKYVDEASVLIETSHPSPRGSLNSRTPFIGSRIFTTINDKLVGLGKQPINWKL